MVNEPSVFELLGCEKMGLTRMCECGGCESGGCESGGCECCGCKLPTYCIEVLFTNLDNLLRFGVSNNVVSHIKYRSKSNVQMAYFSLDRGDMRECDSAFSVYNK